MTIAVIDGGTRENGNTKILTERVVQGLEADSIELRKYQIHPIVDQRHDPDGFEPVADDVDAIIRRILPHHTLIFSTPLYWYGMSGIMKNFIDRWSQAIRDANLPNFKQQMAAKQAYVIVVGGDQPSLKALPLIQQFQYIFQFIGISFEGHVIGTGVKPGDILNDHQALFAAEQIRKRLKSDQRTAAVDDVPFNKEEQEQFDSDDEETVSLEDLKRELKL